MEDGEIEVFSADPEDGYSFDGVEFASVFGTALEKTEQEDADEITYVRMADGHHIGRLSVVKTTREDGSVSHDIVFHRREIDLPI